MLTPHLSACMLATANNSHLVTLTEDEYAGIGYYRVMKRDVIQWSLSEYLLNFAFGVLDAEILYKSRQQRPRLGGRNFPLEKRKCHPSTFQTRSPHVRKNHTSYSNLPKEVQQTVTIQKVDNIWFLPASGQRPQVSKLS